MNFDLIIFDYDGVVADSEVINNAALAEKVCALGWAITAEQSLALFLGRRWSDFRHEIEAQLGHACPDSFIDDWTRLCHTRAAESLAPVTGLHAFVASRPEARCIASSSPPAWIELGLARFDLQQDLGPIYSAAVHVTRGKPHPDLFLHAADAMNAAPHRTLVIEDSVPGVLAGVAAGMTVVGLCAGGHIRDGHAEGLLDAGAHHLVESYEELSSLDRLWGVGRAVVG